MERGTTLRCERCGDSLSGAQCCAGAEAAIVHDEQQIRASFSPGDPARDQWRYAPFLPADGDPVTLGEGGTDLVDAPAAGERIGVDLSLKLEGGNPTGSTKDRGSSVLVTHARERGATVACASTGNAAASVAAYAARGGLACRLFVPADAPETKALQPLVHGARLLAVEGSYDDAYDLCRAAAAEGGWLDRSAGASVRTRAGARTLGYELAEQAPDADWVVVPMGNGGTIAGAWAGLETFADLGYLADPPQLLGVQAEGATAIHDAVAGDPVGGDSDTGSGPETLADSIDVGTPHRLEAAAGAIAESGGASVTVTDAAIESATATLARREGVFVEPACAAAVAGIERARERGTVDRGDSVVAVMTGTGLKDDGAARRVVGEVERVPADADPRSVADQFGE